MEANLGGRLFKVRVLEDQVVFINRDLFYQNLARRPVALAMG